MKRTKWIRLQVALLLVGWGLSGCRDKAAVSQHPEDPIDKTLPPLMIAAKYGDLTSVRRLLKAGADANARSPMGNTALHFAAGHGHLQVVEALLDAHADANASDPNGYTPLHAAVHGDDVRVVNALIAAHADVNARTKRENVTPLLESIDMNYGKPEITLALIQAGADVNVVESDGNTALSIAMTESSNEVVEALLKKGADPNSLVHNQRPLHVAAEYGYDETIKVLLRYGADPTLRNPGGQTPLDVINAQRPEVRKRLASTALLLKSASGGH
jgi:uncharacterized protein